MTEQIFILFLAALQWRRPPKLDIVPLVVYGCNSTEKESQAKRERTVLQEIFFSAAMIPDTPKEPDLEAVEYVEPKRIPLEDVSQNQEHYMACFNFSCSFLNASFSFSF